MAAKKPSPAMDFIVSYLKKNKKASYGDVQAAAVKKRLTIYPIMYGRAQALLGIVKSAPRGSKKKAAAKKAAQQAAGGVRKNKKATARRSASGGGSLDSIVETVRTLEAERDEYRDALERLRDVLDTALSR